MLRGRHVLPCGERLAAAAGRNGRERLVVALVANLQMRAPGAAGSGAAGGGRELADVGAVGLKRRAVAAMLAVHVTGDAREERRRVLVPRRHPGGRVAQGGRRIHGAALLRRHEDVAVGRERLGGRPPLPGPSRTAGFQRGAARAVRRGAEVQAGVRLRRRTREDLDHAAQRVGPVEIARAAPHRLHPIHQDLGNTAPVHPAAERIVQRHTVGQDEHAAGAGRGEPAHPGALRGRVGGTRRGAPEEAEARHDAQGIVQGHRRGKRQVRGGQDRDGRGRARGHALGARGGHHHGFRVGGQNEGDRQRAAGGHHLERGKPGRLDRQPIARRGAVQRERARVGRRGLAIRLDRGDANRRAGYRSASLIGNSPLQGRGCRDAGEERAGDDEGKQVRVAHGRSPMLVGRPCPRIPLGWTGASTLEGGRPAIAPRFEHVCWLVGWQRTCHAVYLTFRPGARKLTAEPGWQARRRFGG